MLERINDQKIATNERYAFSIEEKKNKAVFCIENSANLWNEFDLKWDFKGDTFTINGNIPDGSFIDKKSVLKTVNDTMLLVSVLTNPDQSTADAKESRQYRRVMLSKSDYLGTWQVIDGTLDSINKVRYIFSETGTYEYYSLKGEEWQKNADVGGTWFCYGGFIVMNAPGKEKIEAQLWDTSIAEVGSDKTWLQTNTDASGVVLQSRTLKFIKK